MITNVLVHAVFLFLLPSHWLPWYGLQCTRISFREECWFVLAPSPTSPPRIVTFPSCAHKTQKITTCVASAWLTRRVMSTAFCSTTHSTSCKIPHVVMYIESTILPDDAHMGERFAQSRMMSSNYKRMNLKIKIASPTTLKEQEQSLVLPFYFTQVTFVTK